MNFDTAFAPQRMESPEAPGVPGTPPDDSCLRRNASQSSQKLQALLQKNSAHGFCVAYSGGLDSRFLAHAAQTAGVPVLLLHASGPHIAPEDSAYAEQWAKEHGLPFRSVAISPLSLPEVAQGSPERCYACKRALFGRLQFESPFPLCDGTHMSDMQGYRPGLRALAELGIQSPLAEAGFTKATIRLASVENGLDNPTQRARPCLLTRLPYGLQPTEDRLATLAKGEQTIRQILATMYTDIPDFRLRLTAPDTLELHLQRVEDAVLPLLAERLEASDSPYVAKIISMDRVSGYFDRQKP